MLPRLTLRRWLPLLLALGACGCGRAVGDHTTDSPTDLGVAEVRQARALAEAQLPAAAEPQSPRARVYFIKADLLPPPAGEPTRRLVMVHHYRYEGDVTVLTMVDLDAQQVVQSETVAHFPTALASEERERAAELARRDERVRPLLDEVVALDFRPIQYARTSEPLFGHRVVHVMLRTDRGHFSRPRVLVDLSTDTVHLAD